MYKLNCCVAVAGASVPLILAGSTSGTLLGLKTVERFVDPAEIAADTTISGITSLLVVSVYAEFTPGDDAALVLGAGGSAALGIPLQVNIVDGTFFQHPFGNADHLSPSAALVNVPGFNTLRHDSFVTIGRKLDDDPIDGVDQTQTIGLDSWTSTLLTGSDEVVWFVAGFPPQGDAGSAPDNPPNEVLVGQFTVANPGPNVDIFVQMFADGIHTNAQGVQEAYQVPVVAFPPLFCPDLDGDSVVAVPDLLELLAAWGTEPGGPPDFDGDGIVGRPDLLMLLPVWGPCPAGAQATSEGCPWDCQAVPDGTVNVLDLLALLGAWGTIGNQPCDIVVDEIVNIPDLLALLGQWGLQCP